jgi:hypothetical protein
MEPAEADPWYIKDLDLARRAVACTRWQWRPGMWWKVQRTPRLAGLAVRIVEYGHAPPRNALPDLDDPATLGCLRELVREGHNDPTICALWRESNGRDVVVLTGVHSHRIAAWNHDLRTEPGGPFLSEAAALVAALESSP